MFGVTGDGTAKNINDNDNETNVEISNDQLISQLVESLNEEKQERIKLEEQLAKLRKGIINPSITHVISEEIDDVNDINNDNNDEFEHINDPKVQEIVNEIKSTETIPNTNNDNDNIIISNNDLDGKSDNNDENNDTNNNDNNYNISPDVINDVPLITNTLFQSPTNNPTKKAIIEESNAPDTIDNGYTSSDKNQENDEYKKSQLNEQEFAQTKLAQQKKMNQQNETNISNNKSQKKINPNYVEVLNDDTMLNDYSQFPNKNIFHEYAKTKQKSPKNNTINNDNTNNDNNIDVNKTVLLEPNDDGIETNDGIQINKKQPHFFNFMSYF